MASHLDSDAVQYVCDCGRPNRINKLFFCRHCLKLRCGRCACTQVDSFFCSSCLENIPSAEAKFASNRCTKCYDCPSCQHTLTSRAAKPPAPVAVVGDGGEVAAAGRDKEPPAGGPKRKVYYLMCSACRWTSRDVGIPDRPVATGQWPDLEYAHATRFAALLDHCRNVVLHDKQAMQDWARRKAPGQQKYASLTDRTGLTVAIARRTLGWTDKSAPKRVSRPAAINASVATDAPQPLPEELLTKPLHLAGVTTLRQRLHLPATQPHTVDGLHPAHKSLSIKRSVRCGQCEHYVIKPEFNPASIKYRIHSLASGHVPIVRLMRANALVAGQTCAVRVKFINPTAHDMRVSLAPLSPLKGGVDDDDDDDDDGSADGGAGDGISSPSGVVLQLPVGAFVVQRRDDSTEFDGDTALPDEPPFVLWRRSNAVIVELKVRAPMETPPGGEVLVGFVIGHNYVNAFPGATSTSAVGDSSLSSSAAAGGDGGRSAEHSLSTRVHLQVGRVQ